MKELLIIVPQKMLKEKWLCNCLEFVFCTGLYCFKNVFIN